MYASAPRGVAQRTQATPSPPFPLEPTSNRAHLTDEPLTSLIEPIVDTSRGPASAVSRECLDGRGVRCGCVRRVVSLGGGPLLVKLVEVFGRVVRMRMHTWRLRGARVVLAARAVGPRSAAVRRALTIRTR
ncbi:unnamed protein product [Pieris macdunnoughi]|uniref:Uncharacterized protein n=1 Tax=Pieris macdunnoughi TaxID=345717 RepID=A0A821QXH1_9NEOP|nr:unnamed protein product [Pieris macdunnoughi]